MIKPPPNKNTQQKIQALFLATELPTKQKEALFRLGFEEFDNNVFALRPADMSKEECQAVLKTQRHPLVSIDTTPLTTIDEMIDWLNE